MSSRKIILILLLTVVVSACEVKMGPSNIWSKWFNTQTDSAYYQEKAEDLVKGLSQDSLEYEINKVAVIDLVNEKGKSPVLGDYLSSRVIEAIARKRVFRVAQKGEVQDVLAQLNLPTSFSYTRRELKSLGTALNSQAIVTGKFTDLGTNLDVHLTLIDVVSGEVIASSTEPLTRTKFAVEMLRHY